MQKLVWKSVLCARMNSPPDNVGILRFDSLKEAHRMSGILRSWKGKCFLGFKYMDDASKDYRIVTESYDCHLESYFGKKSEDWRKKCNDWKKKCEDLKKSIEDLEKTKLEKGRKKKCEADLKKLEEKGTTWWQRIRTDFLYYFRGVFHGLRVLYQKSCPHGDIKKGMLVSENGEAKLAFMSHTVGLADTEFWWAAHKDIMEVRNVMLTILRMDDGTTWGNIVPEEHFSRDIAYFLNLDQPLV